MTSAIRDFGTGVETQGRAIGSSAHNLVRSAGDGESSRARIVREIRIPPIQLISWLASALYAATTLLVSEGGGVPSDGRVAGDFIIVDKALTRC